MAGLVDSIKNDVKKAGTNKSKFIYFREGQKQRVRFLVDMDDGMEVKFLVRNCSEEIVRIAKMMVYVLVVSMCGLFTITRPRKYSCLCSRSITVALFRH